MLGVIGAAALSVSFGAPAQDIDNRPIYYVMLKSLESGFKTYNEELVSTLEARIADLRSHYESARDAITMAFAELETAHQQRVSAFTSERDALNERIRALNEQIALRDGRASEARRINGRFADDPQVKTLTDGLATEHTRLAGLEEEYRSDVEATRQARAALTRQFEEFTRAGDPLALEIRLLEREWQRFAEGERSKLKNLADSYAEDYAAYNDWLNGERAALEELGADLAGAVDTDREQRELHARLEAELRDLIDQYNALVEVHNAAGSDDPGRDERAARFAAMEERIGVLQSDLAHARETVLDVGEVFRSKKREYDDRYEHFVGEKRQKEARLAGDLAEINDARAAVEADIDARRHKVDTQIKALEAQISSELEGARRNLEMLARRLRKSFGRDHEGLDVAIHQFLENGDDMLLYNAVGAPRFDLSRPKTAAVYRSVERILADRRRLDARIVALEGDESTSQQALGDGARRKTALEGKRAALGAERQQLLEAHASFAREHQARVAALQRREADLEKRFVDERTRLEEVFSLRADATRSEFQLVQQVLVAVIRGRSRLQVNPGEHTRALNALRERAVRLDATSEASVVNPHALLASIAAGLPADAGTHPGWQPFTRDAVVASRTLTGKDKARVASAWLARYRRDPRYTAIAGSLDDTGAVASGDEALAILFIDGVFNHMTLEEQRLEGDGVGIRVGVLGRHYLLEANGSLERLPDR